MFFVSNDEEYNPTQSKVFLTLQKVFSLDINNHSNHYSTVVNGKKVFTALFAAIVLLGFTDLLFALDSLPAVIGISQNKLVIYTSNIFAVLGLRSLFFILKTAATKFDYLQQGIAIVLVFIGIKMLFEHYINLHFSKNTQIIASLMVILACITSSILFSWYKNKTTST